MYIRKMSKSALTVVSVSKHFHGIRFDICTHIFVALCVTVDHFWFVIHFSAFDCAKTNGLAAMLGRKRIFDHDVKKNQSASEIGISIQKQDPFCWLCHQKLPTIKCEHCVRSFHNACIGLERNSGYDPIQKCDSCQKLHDSIVMW